MLLVTDDGDVEDVDDVVMGVDDGDVLMGVTVGGGGGGCGGGGDSSYRLPFIIVHHVTPVEDPFVDPAVQADPRPDTLPFWMSYRAPADVSTPRSPMMRILGEASQGD